MLWEWLSAVFASGGASPRRHLMGGGGEGLEGAFGGAQPAPGLELEPILPFLARCYCSRLPSRSHAPTSTCVAEAVGGGSSTPRVPRVAAATMGAAADLTAGRHGWPRSLSGGARLRYCCYCVRVCV